MSAHELLGAVLDRLLPAVDELRGAGGLGLAATVLDDPLLRVAPRAIEAVLERLPPDFVELEPCGQDTALRAAQAADPDGFGILISAAYNAYYVDPRVLARIDRLTEYNAGAPQPDGYEIEPFDETLLVQIRQREPFWREVES